MAGHSLATIKKEKRKEKGRKLNNFDYYYWKKFFNSNELKDLNKICNTYKEINFIDGPATKDNKKLKNVDRVESVKWIHLKKPLHKLYESIVITNGDKYGYHINPMLDVDSVLFNTYVKGNFYDWHKDESRSHYHDYKFTILINNSTNKYSGGDFQIFSTGGEKTIDEFNQPGDVVMFKSDIPHKVLPIKTGERNSIAFFIKGSKFV